MSELLKRIHGEKTVFEIFTFTPPPYLEPEFSTTLEDSTSGNFPT